MSPPRPTALLAALLLAAVACAEEADPSPRPDEDATLDDADATDLDGGDDAPADAPTEDEDAAPDGGGADVVPTDADAGPCGLDRLEPNDSAEEATPLAPGVYADLQLCREDDDWFAFALEEGQTLTLQIDYEHRGREIVIILFDPDSTFVGAWTGDIPRLSYTAPRAGGWLVRVDQSVGRPVAWTATVEIE